MPGRNLTELDFQNLEACWITRELAEQAMLRRVDSIEGSTIIGSNRRGDYSGIVIPYILPGQEQVREYRLRRDHPDYERDEKGNLRPRNRYLSPPGRSNLLYFVPGTPRDLPQDVNIPVAVVEGEKKALALWRLAWLETLCPRVMAVGLSGVWNWRGTVGKIAGANGGRCNVKGSIPDLDRINWTARKALIVFDTNVRTNSSVAAARVALSIELGRRGAAVFWIELPDVPGVNGVDDLLAVRGPEAVVPLFDAARPFTPCFNLTDYGNAERLAMEFGTHIRFCHAWQEWLCWDGRRWVLDENDEVVRFAKRTVRNLYREASDIEDDERRKRAARWAHESERAARITAMIKLAQSEQDIPVAADGLDSDQWVFNCLNGTVDLRTGQARSHRTEDLITKLVRIEHIPGARCQRWMQFLGEVFAPHPDIIPFIQRAIGYSLTGDTREECLFLLWGKGRNGKGTFIKTIAAVLGDYAGTADFSAFVQGRTGGPRDDVANMKGKRFISAQEAREGAGLDEAMVKWLTGGDRVRARRLYENSYEFDPTHKIWLATNHKPTVRGTDPAIWSRLKLIPFEVSFEGREDKALKQALHAELPGILAWAVQGCLSWQREGLDFPESVVSATAEYRRESDQVGRFTEECCVVGESLTARARQLYACYKGWAESVGEEVLTETAFGVRFGDRFGKKHFVAGTSYVGVGLKDESTAG